MRQRHDCRVRSIALALLIGLAAIVSACGDDSSGETAPAANETASLERSFGTEDAKEICALSPSNCGKEPQSETDRNPVTVALHDLQRAYLEGRSDAVCARMTDEAKLQAGSMAHGTPTDCETDVERAFRLFDIPQSWLDVENPEVTFAQESEKNGVIVELPGRQRGWIPFVKEDGKWKIDNFFGGKPCGEISAADFPTITGGCKVKALGEKVRISVMTPFGAFKFADCLVSYQFRAAGDGRTWTDFFTVDGPVETGCGDVNPCEIDSTNQTAPWKGRIQQNGEDMIHTAAVCLSTCVGVFRGLLTLRLERDGDKWRGVYQDADVGASGFRFDGELGIEPDDLQLKAAG